MNLNICLSYSSRWELTNAARKLAEKVKRGELSPEDITEESIQAELSTADIPDPDLLIRTGGE
ncbi:MAG: undecaprenyl diphosphate synthase family protein, partial [Muribaculaceae bacterium]|nr:undecaprenyl diphosphate synthase family protein [Muribaculaceae bacterium]